MARTLTPGLIGGNNYIYILNRGKTTALALANHLRVTTLVLSEGINIHVERIKVQSLLTKKDRPRLSSCQHYEKLPASHSAIFSKTTALFLYLISDSGISFLRGCGCKATKMTI